MALSSLALAVEYVANGVATDFTVSFRFLANADLVVTVDGVTKTLDTHYTVTGAGADTGTVSFLVAPANGLAVRIERSMALTQPTAFRTAGAFSPALYEDAIDRLAMQMQQVNAVQIAEVSSGGDIAALSSHVDSVQTDLLAADAVITADVANTLHKTGGSFALSAEVDFGASYGLKSAVFKSRNTPLASMGTVRLAKADTISWRNYANNANLALVPNSDGDLTYNSEVVTTATNSQTLTNKAVVATFLSVIGPVVVNGVADIESNGNGAATVTAADGQVGLVLDCSAQTDRWAPLRLVPMTAPATGNVGDIYMSSADQKVRVCTIAGTPGTWVVIGAQTA